MRINRLIVSAITFAFLAVIGVGTATAQNSNEEYREWQNAQRRAQEEYRDYQRRPTRSNYNDWQEAVRHAQREQMEYQRSLQRGGIFARNRGNRGRFFRVYRDGSYFQVDNRGAALLRQAVQRGYQQGYAAGVNDRRFGRGYNYYNNSMYMSGSFGYASFVARNQYQHYFQQGFQRGYEDGYYSRTRYGMRSGSTFNILGSVLNTILNIADAADDDDYR
jgi:hypothetical protein